MRQIQSADSCWRWGSDGDQGSWTAAFAMLPTRTNGDKSDIEWADQDPTHTAFELSSSTGHRPVQSTLSRFQSRNDR